MLSLQLCRTPQPHELEPARLLCIWDSPGKNTGVGCHALLQGIFLTQRSNPCVLHCRRILYCWATWETLICHSVSSVAQSCPTLCDPMDDNMPGLPVHHQLPEFTQTHAHWVGDAVQPSHPLSSPSPPAFNLSQHSGSFPISQFFTSGGQCIGASASASVLPMNIQGQFPLGLTGLISLQSKGLSRVFSNTTVQKYQFFSAQLSLWSKSPIHIWLLENHMSLPTVYVITYGLQST